MSIVSNKVNKVNKYGIVVGISDYKTISDLSLSDEDCSDWYRYLISLGYQVKVFGDTHRENYPKYDGLGTEANVRNAFQTALKRAVSGDTVVLTTAGHGHGDGCGNSFICFYECNPNRDTDCYHDYELVQDLKLKKPGVKVFLFFDNCFSGGFLDELKNIPEVTALTAATDHGYGYDYAEGNNGAWTYSFLECGLLRQFGGQAPISKAYQWASENFPKITGKTSEGDQPQMINNNGEDFSL